MRRWISRNQSFESYLLSLRNDILDAFSVPSVVVEEPIVESPRKKLSKQTRLSLAQERMVPALKEPQFKFFWNIFKKHFPVSGQLRTISFEEEETAQKQEKASEKASGKEIKQRSQLPCAMDKCNSRTFRRCRYCNVALCDGCVIPYHNLVFGVSEQLHTAQLNARTDQRNAQSSHTASMEEMKAKPKVSSPTQPPKEKVRHISTTGESIIIIKPPTKEKVKITNIESDTSSTTPPLKKKKRSP
eukprot:Lithocolla_globosa_v1_NODE_35_length_8531_cov_41.341199.p4 type:complete len:244 gc:universal NODE_35_length_8531_cov_41.341199:7044-7775(+)